jgi:uncharacterized protein YjbJ (UPF0337 family)
MAEAMRGAAPMGAKSDDAKGRVKEAAGDLTGDKSLKRQGQADRAGAKVKGKVAKGIDKVKDVIGGEVEVLLQARGKESDKEGMP